MIRRVILSGVEAREELARGAEFLAKAVRSTLGPYGQNWFLDKKDSVTNDGVTVAREIQISSCINPQHEGWDCRCAEVQNRGAKAIREAAIKTVDKAGDGTTTATLLAHEIYTAASRQLDKKNVIGAMRSSEVIRKIEEERKEVTEKLVAMATPIETKEELVHSAIVSVADPDLGKLIGETQWELGKEGILIAETTGERFSSVERVHGLRLDNGFSASQIINNQEKQTLEVEQTHTLVTSYSIKDINDWQKIMKVCEKIAPLGVKHLTIFARAWTDETIRFCLENINKGTMKIYPMNAPYTDMNERMKDLVAVFGGSYIDSETRMLEDLQISDVGYAEKVIAYRFTATVTGKPSKEAEERIVKRTEDLEKFMSGSQSEFEKKSLASQIAQLKNGFGIIKVGSPSDMEMRRLFDKCEDAVNAVRAAFQEGTVKGAGLAFKEIAEGLPDTYILKRPIMALNEQIMSSAPKDFKVEDWVRDPVKVLRVALEQACVAASTFATAGGVSTEEFPRQINEILGKK